MSSFVLDFTTRIGKILYLATPLRSVRRIFFRTFCKMVRNKTVHANADGIAYELDLSEKIDVAIYFDRFEPDMKMAVDRYVKPGQNILDIGANIGAHTLRFARNLQGKGVVYAFEPSSYAFRKLSKNISLNSFSNIITFQVALSESNVANSTFSGRSSWTTDGGRSDDQSVVDFKRLDDWWSEQRHPAIALIKIDTDGNEYGVFAGGTRLLKNCLPIILMEVVWKHFHEPGRNPLLLLQEIGYQFYDIHTQAEYPNLEDIRNHFPVDDHAMSMSINIVGMPANHQGAV